MNKDEFSDNAKAPGKKSDTAKSSASSANQIRPLPPVPRPPFAGPMPIAVNIKPAPPVVKPVQESMAIKSEETKDE